MNEFCLFYQCFYVTISFNNPLQYTYTYLNLTNSNASPPNTKKISKTNNKKNMYKTVRELFQRHPY